MRWMLLAALALAGCNEIRNATNAGAQNVAAAEARSEQEDVDSWRGVPLLELETHPLYSTLTKKVDELSDGSELWSLARCQDYEIAARCSSYPIGSVQFTQCSGGRLERTCCIRQFRVRDQVVQGFRALGPCVTGCQVRPGGCQARL